MKVGQNIKISLTLFGGGFFLATTGDARQKRPPYEGYGYLL